MTATLAAACGPGKRDAGEPDPEASAPIPTCDAFQAAPAEARLLTRSEYRRTVVDLLGTQLDPTSDFPPEPLVNGFSNNAASHQVNPLLIEKYFRSAGLLAQEAVTQGLGRLYNCPAELTQVDCADAFLLHVTTRAYRRPPDDAERASLRRLYERVAPALGHDQALGTALEVILQSPQFLYRVEAPIAPAQGDVIALGPYELASRLSYFFLGSMPDEELLAVAQHNALSTQEQVEAQARRLLGSPGAFSRVREFHSAWLGLDQLNSIARDDAPPGFAQSLRESILQFTDSVVWFGTTSVAELYTSPRLAVDATLAPVFHLPVPAPGEWVHHDVEAERRGLLTQPGLLALLAHADQSSPIQRGVFVRDKLFCAPVEPPPPSVDNNPPDPQPGLTTRDLVAVHTQDPACARCHQLIDPLGFGFEAYDQLGRYRATQDDIPIDATGELVGLPEEALNGPFADAFELATKAAASETVLQCLGDKWFTFAMGRGGQASDECSLGAAQEQALASGGSIQELLVALAASDSFRFRARHESDVVGGTP